MYVPNLYSDPKTLKYFLFVSCISDWYLIGMESKSLLSLLYRRYFPQASLIILGALSTLNLIHWEIRWPFRRQFTKGETRGFRIKRSCFNTREIYRKKCESPRSAQRIIVYTITLYLYGSIGLGFFYSAKYNVLLMIFLTHWL